MISDKTFASFLNNNEKAICDVFDEYKNLLYFIISSYVPTKEDCDDILNDTYLKILENKNSIEDKTKLKQYVTTIAKNEALQFLRKQRTYFTDKIDELYGESDSSNTILNSLFEFLTNIETIIVGYRVLFDYSWEEINKETNIPISTAKLKYKNAMEKLRQKLK